MGCMLNDDDDDDDNDDEVLKMIRQFSNAAFIDYIRPRTRHWLHRQISRSTCIHNTTYEQ